MAATIFLIGFMGVGKSTLGKKIASRLDLQFIDLDNFIEEIHSTTIPSIIDNFGIEQFRLWESEALKQIPLNGVVCSTGGGTPCYFDNMRWMSEHGQTVWVHLPEAAILSRLAQGERDKRPLLRGKGDAELKTFIAATLQERNPFYKQAAIRYDAIKSNLTDLIQILGKAMD
jgi:shikimate kinase